MRLSIWGLHGGVFSYHDRDEILGEFHNIFLNFDTAMYYHILSVA